MATSIVIASEAKQSLCRNRIASTHSRRSQVCSWHRITLTITSSRTLLMAAFLHPVGMRRACMRTSSGGIAALNHRLPALTPPASTGDPSLTSGVMAMKYGRLEEKAISIKAWCSSFRTIKRPQLMLCQTTEQCLCIPSGVILAVYRIMALWR
jgi:hypothetical protein